MMTSFISYLFSTVSSPKIVYIPKGSVFNSIAHLHDEGVNVHLIDAIILRFIGRPQQGWIDLEEEKMSRIHYLRKLTTAKGVTRRITLIPGETTVIFLRGLARELRLDETKLMDAHRRLAERPEGNFVPDTYSIPNEVDEEKLISYLLKESERRMRRWAQGYGIPYTDEDWLPIVTKASIIQKEASSIADMPMVSSVIENRLKIGMKLQMDGTLNYGEYSHQKVTAQRILTDKSPYNTYKAKGLPPYPVCNVSREAIHAAIYPAQSDYLYFVRGKDGEHVYSSYFSTHRQNIENATIRNK